MDTFSSRIMLIIAPVPYKVIRKKLHLGADYKMKTPMASSPLCSASLARSQLAYISSQLNSTRQNTETQAHLCSGACYRSVIRRPKVYIRTHMLLWEATPLGEKHTKDASKYMQSRETSIGTPRTINISSSPCVMDVQAKGITTKVI